MRVQRQSGGSKEGQMETEQFRPSHLLRSRVIITRTILLLTKYYAQHEPPPNWTLLTPRRHISSGHPITQLSFRPPSPNRIRILHPSLRWFRPQPIILEFSFPFAFLHFLVLYTTQCISTNSSHPASIHHHHQFVLIPQFYLSHSCNPVTDISIWYTPWLTARFLFWRRHDWSSWARCWRFGVVVNFFLMDWSFKSSFGPPFASSFCIFARLSCCLSRRIVIFCWIMTRAINEFKLFCLQKHLIWQMNA